MHASERASTSALWCGVVQMHTLLVRTLHRMCVCLDLFAFSHIISDLSGIMGTSQSLLHRLCSLSSISQWRENQVLPVALYKNEPLFRYQSVHSWYHPFSFPAPYKHAELHCISTAILLFSQAEIILAPKVHFHSTKGSSSCGVAILKPM